MFVGLESCDVLLRRYRPSSPEAGEALAALRVAYEALSEGARALLAELGKRVEREVTAPLLAARDIDAELDGATIRYLALIDQAQPRFEAFETELRDFAPRFLDIFGRVALQVGSSLAEDDALRIEFVLRTLTVCMRMAEKTEGGIDPSATPHLGRILVALTALFAAFLSEDESQPSRETAERLTVAAWKASSEAYGILRAPALGDSRANAA